YEFAVGERLHFSVLAVMAKCPFLSINYRPKHNDFFETVSLLAAGVDPTTVTPDLLEKKFSDRNNFSWNDAFNRLKSLRDLQKNEVNEYLKTVKSSNTDDSSLTSKNLLT
ncbi:MAG: hypothetical protein AAGA62_07605, partial [Bacteroidota bacterium]